MQTTWKIAVLYISSTGVCLGTLWLFNNVLTETLRIELLKDAGWVGFLAILLLSINLSTILLFVTGKIIPNNKIELEPEDQQIVSFLYFYKPVNGILNV